MHRAVCFDVKASDCPRLQGGSLPLIYVVVIRDQVGSHQFSLLGGLQQS